MRITNPVCKQKTGKNVVSHYKGICGISMEILNFLEDRIIDATFHFIP
jgi:hypothetical protein